MKNDDDMNNIIYLYCRVSTSNQGKDGVSLDVQEERGLEVSKRLGLTPVVIKEQGSGLKSYHEVRPQFSELMDKVIDGEVKNIWIDELTRLTRNDVDYPSITYELSNNDVNLYVGSDGQLKEWGFETKLLDTIITMVNQNQIQKQIRKSIRSQKRLHKEGYWMKGKPPFGYDVVDRKLVINKKESEILRNIFNYYDQGVSIYKIHQETFSLGYSYTPRTIRGWLSNEVYIGICKWNNRSDLTFQSPKIIDEKVFNSVQKKLKQKTVRTLTPKTDFLLRDIIKCPDGSNMSTLGKKKSRKNPLYTCRHRKRKYQGRHKTVDCSISKSLRQELMDDYVWNSLVDVFSQSHQIREKTKKELIGKKVGYAKRGIHKKIKNLQKEIYELEQKRLVVDKKFYTNEMEEKKYNIIVETIEEKEKGLFGLLTSQERKLDTLQKNTNWVDWLDVHFSRMDEIRNIEDFNEKRDILLHYIHEIVLLNYDEDTKQHTISIKFRFPLFNDNHMWINNKDGSYRRDKTGRRK